jgi:hypothetical protein
MRVIRLVLAAVLTLAVSSAAHAQGSFLTSLSGTVVDTQGGVIPGADVKIKNNGTGAENLTVTAANGTFSVPSLPGGIYSVVVSLQGFKTVTLSTVTLNAAVPASVKVVMAVGAVEENVTVVGDSGLVVQTQTPSVATTMSATQIISLPLTSRNAIDSLTSLPGFNTSGTARDSTISGLPKSSINITLDGMSIQDNYLKTSDGFFARLQPGADAVEEVTVTTAANTADVSGQGGAQIKFVTRAGTNNLTGSVYEYYRNDKFNANTWFNNRDLPPDPATGNAPKAALRQHTPGFRVGGPIIQDKAFFFVNYEQFRRPSNLTQTRIVLTPAAQSGIFAYTANGVTRQVNLLQLAAAAGVPNTFDPTVSKVLNDIRSAMATQGSLTDLSNPAVQQYNFQVPTTSLNTFPVVRLDYNATQNHRITGSFNYNHINSTPDTTNTRQASFPGFAATGSQQSTRWTTSEGLRSTFGSNMVNEFRIGATGGATLFSPEFTPDVFGPQGGYHLNLATACCTGSNALYNVDSFTGTSATYQAREASTRIIDDTFTWIKGGHSFAFGSTFTQGDLWIDNQQIVPSITFGLVTGDPAIGLFSPTNFPNASTTDINNARGLYSLLTGHVSSVVGDARLTPEGDKYVYLGTGEARARLREFDFFAADSWRARSNLTINYGVRYALQFPFYPMNNALTTATVDSLWGASGVNNIFKPSSGGGVKPTFVQFPQGQYAYNTDLNNIAPSIGAAWSAPASTGLLSRLLGREEGDSVFRGGFGTAYERPGMSNFTDVFGTNPGLRITGVTDRTESNGNIAVGALLRNPSQVSTPAFNATPSYPITASIGQSVNIMDSNLKIPYAQSWTVGWQRKLSRNSVFEARYVGSRHVDDWVQSNINEINIVENGFVNEFRKAQANMAANIAAGRGNTFAYTGIAGTSPLPIILAYFNGVNASAAGDPTKYTSTSFNDTTFLNALALFNPQPCCSTSTTTPSFAWNLMNSAARRSNALAAGLPANLFLANPDVLGPGAGSGNIGSNFITNGAGTRYNSAQFEFRQRLRGGASIGINYVFGRAYAQQRYGFRQPDEEILQSGTVGGVTHALKGNWVFDLPFGREHRWANNLPTVVDRIVGGWQISGVGRIQTGELLDLGNVRLVGMSEKDLQDSVDLRVGANGQLFILPDDIVQNTFKAFNVGLTGYGALGAPAGRYMAPANGPDCLEVTPGFGQCGTRSLVITAPRLIRFDLSAVKRIQLRGRTSAEFRVEMLNALNSPYFNPNVNNTTTGGFTQQFTPTYEGAAGIPLTNSTTTSVDNYRLTTLLGDNQSRVIQLVWRFSW